MEEYLLAYRTKKFQRCADIRFALTHGPNNFIKALFFLFVCFHFCSFIKLCQIRFSLYVLKNWQFIYPFVPSVEKCEMS